MKCPSCNKEIKFLATNCSFCNYEFPTQIYQKLSIYFDLNDQLQNLGVMNNDFHKRLVTFSEKLNLYQEILSGELDEVAQPIKELKIEKTKEAEVKFQETPQEVIKPEPSSAEKATEETIIETIIETTEATKEKAEKKPEKEVAFAQKAHTRSKEKAKVLPEETFSEDFEANVGQKWLLIVGIVTMVFGIGYFLKYSFDQGWIGAAGRVALAYLWGISFLIGGAIFQKKNYKLFGLFLIGGGIAVLYFSTYAGFGIYELFPQTLSFGLMVLITVLASFLAILYDTKWLAVLGLIGGFLTPVFLSTGQDNQIALMTYMIILNLGLLSIAFYKKWDLLNFLGFFFTYFLFSGWFIVHYEEVKFWRTLIFLNSFYLIYCIIPFVYLILNKEETQLKSFYIVSPNAFIAFGYSFYMIESYSSTEWAGFTSIIYAGLFLFMATYLYRKKKEEVAGFVLLVGQAALFLVITVPILFSEYWITFFWSAQALTLLWIGLKLNKKVIVIASYVLLTYVLLKFFFWDYPYTFQFYDYNSGDFSFRVLERYFTIFFLLGTGYGFSFLLKCYDFKLMSGNKANDSSYFFGIWGFVLFLIMNIETLSYFDSFLPDAKFAALSVMWGLFSIVLIILGFRSNSLKMRQIALAIFLITILKVFLVDMQHFSTPYRILSFIIVGLILIAASYLYHKYKDKIAKVLSGTEEKEKEDKQ